MLREIPDAYPDFVRYTPTEIVLEGLADDFIDYKNANSELTTSDVLEWIIDKAGWEREVSERHK